MNTKLQYLGAVVQDRNASMAIIEQKPMVIAFPQSQASKDMTQVAYKLMNASQEEYKKNDGIAKVFLNFIRSRKKK